MAGTAGSTEGHGYLGGRHSRVYRGPWLFRWPARGLKWAEPCARQRMCATIEVPGERRGSAGWRQVNSSTGADGQAGERCPPDAAPTRHTTHHTPLPHTPHASRLRPLASPTHPPPPPPTAHTSTHHTLHILTLTSTPLHHIPPYTTHSTPPSPHPTPSTSTHAHRPNQTPCIIICIHHPPDRPPSCTQARPTNPPNPIHYTHGTWNKSLTEAAFHYAARQSFTSWLAIAIAGREILLFIWAKNLGHSHSSLKCPKV